MIENAESMTDEKVIKLIANAGSADAAKLRIDARAAEAKQRIAEAQTMAATSAGTDEAEEAIDARAEALKARIDAYVANASADGDDDSEGDDDTVQEPASVYPSQQQEIAVRITEAVRELAVLVSPDNAEAVVMACDQLRREADDARTDGHPEAEWVLIAVDLLMAGIRLAEEPVLPVEIDAPEAEPDTLEDPESFEAEIPDPEV